jgi:hypothetical protein
MGYSSFCFSFLLFITSPVLLPNIHAFIIDSTMKISISIALTLSALALTGSFLVANRADNGVVTLPWKGRAGYKCTNTVKRPFSRRAGGEAVAPIVGSNVCGDGYYETLNGKDHSF